jgi:cell division protein FtsZ
MIFVTAGMGGGTGTGAAPVIASAAKELGILTVGIITVPFKFEGRKRRSQAEEGIEKMRQAVDTLLVINNDKLREMFGNLSLVNAFEQADDVLAIAAKGIAEVISVTGQINVDFNDVNTVMKDSGVAIMGSAEAEGEDRANKCVENALLSPLLNDNNIEGATYVLLNITYGAKAVLMDELSEITDYIQDEAGSTADVIWGHGYDESLGEKLCVTIIATGFNTSPNTGIPMRQPEKIKISLEDERPTIITQEIENPVQDNPIVQESVVKQQVEEDVPLTNEVKRYVLEEEQVDQVQDYTNEANEIVKEHTELETETNDGKIRFMLEEEEESEPITEPSPEIITKNIVENEQPIELINDIDADERSTETKEMTEDRINRIKLATQKLRSPLGLNEMENEPAFKRRNIELDNVKKSNDSNISRFTLWENEDENGAKNIGLSDSNSFLHDNVD